jgi:EAL domain-containing protein (putative c-di-GMP-specific phosphodiesterase class I)/ActR/RegA family two-component response regulator
MDRVLVVDDDPNVLAGIQRIAGRHFEIEGLTSGDEAVRRLERGERYAAIVSDLMMKGIDGIAFLERARELSRWTPRIMLTGHADQSVLIDAINRARVAGFLQKPAPVAEFIGMVRKAIADAATPGDMQASVPTRGQELIAADLATADLDAEFRLLFQPRISTATGAVVSAECLLRWTHPRRGAISPLDFIPVAEATGQIERLTAWVVRQAARGWRTMCAAGLDVPVSVNVSLPTIGSPSFVDLAVAILSEEGMPANRLEIEITESHRLTKTDQVRVVVAALRRLGVRVALDDFGTGYSFFETLRWLDIDILKVDRSFVMNLSASSKNQKIVCSIIDLADSLKLTVIAEGVETREQASLLHGLGVRQLQGFLFAKPQTLEAFVADGVVHRDHRILHRFEAFAEAGAA